jgi:hypothetical protein
MKSGGLTMRILIASVAIALMMVSAHAQDMGKIRKHQHAQKTEDTRKTKADELAYKEALKRIPDSTKKVDPWQNVRWSPSRRELRSRSRSNLGAPAILPGRIVA